MTVMHCIIIYISAVIAFCAWDALVGWGVEFNGRESPPPIVPALFWPIAVPIILITNFVNALSSVKTKRISRENQKKQIRIKLEEEAIQQQLEINVEIENLEREEKASKRL